MPAVKKGAKGRWLLRFFFLIRIKIKDTKPPIRKDNIRANIIAGQPKIIPKNGANKASPQPIAFSLLITTIKAMITNEDIIPQKKEEK